MGSSAAALDSVISVNITHSLALFYLLVIISQECKSLQLNLVYCYFKVAKTRPNSNIHFPQNRPSLSPCILPIGQSCLPTGKNGQRGRSKHLDFFSLVMRFIFWCPTSPTSPWDSMEVFFWHPLCMRM